MDVSKGKYSAGGGNIYFSVDEAWWLPPNSFSEQYQHELSPETHVLAMVRCTIPAQNFLICKLTFKMIFHFEKLTLPYIEHLDSSQWWGFFFFFSENCNSSSFVRSLNEDKHGSPTLLPQQQLHRWGRSWTQLPRYPAACAPPFFVLEMPWRDAMQKERLPMCVHRLTYS